ncbi:ubiquinol-cytochrome C reductase-like protein [Metarhizium rileyi]|uniref:Complex III subunit 7 n=1 Tax=Metarhizium rileyi (strain RCEF 4871) TaxID=1649241 RepID=A0A166W5S4_METRR|nr:ubiquinol-cytochrome C reductase-like protein [Metarhizium rileyi RCEF 4871]
MSGYSLAPFILRRPWLANMVMPAANWYANAAGYKKLGLRYGRIPTLPDCDESPPRLIVTQISLEKEGDQYDDLVEEERETTQIALRRLSSKETYDRIYRIRRSVQCSYQHKLLPRDQWTKSEEDTPYLRDIIAQVETELAEKDALDSMSVSKRH